MSTATMTLTEFVLARIAEDAAWANAHDGGAVHDFAYPPGGDPNLNQPDGIDRILNECQAKRSIVDEHAELVNPHDDVVYCRMCVRDAGFGSGGDALTGQKFPCRTLRALAAPYADHPDYLTEWRP